MRFYNYIVEAKKQDQSVWTEYSWKDITTRNEKEFINWITKKSTKFYYGEWEQERHPPDPTAKSQYKTEDEMGNELKLVIRRDREQHVTKGGTRDPEKTKRWIQVDLHLGGVSFPIMKKTTRGEDFEKDKKFKKQGEKVVEILQKTFGIDIKMI